MTLCRFTEEPDEVKVSRPVLKTSGFREKLAEFTKRLEIEHPRYLISDTILYEVLDLLESENAITFYWKNLPGRGRPRRMLKLNPHWQTKAIELAYFWQNPNVLMGDPTAWQQLKVQRQAQISLR